MLTTVGLDYDPGDFNCENFGFTAPSHLTPSGDPCAWNPDQIIRYKDIDEDFGSSTWTCPRCDTVFEAYIPINSDIQV